ncbi:MAG: hypothetical protein E7225_07780 [Clostridiales bacterium]|nr:hypothetical protein [Clostridiales bacterium]
MAIYDMTIREFTEALRAKTPTPGGGGAAAITGALGAALVMMATEFTLDNEKYADEEFVAKSVRAYMSPIYMNLLGMAEQDKQAYEKVAAALKMPKGTEEEKAARAEALSNASYISAKVCFNTMDLCHGGLQEISKAAGHTNPNLDSDLVVAYNLFVAGFNSALHLMKQNIPSITNEKAVDLFNEKIEVFVEKHAEIVAEIKEKLEIQ